MEGEGASHYTSTLFLSDIFVPAELGGGGGVTTMAHMRGSWHVEEKSVECLTQIVRMYKHVGCQ